MSSAVAELENYLQSMLALKPPGVSGSKINSITSLCTANVQNESVLIQKIYTHFKKAPGTHKLGVLYVVDSVTRQWVEAARKAGQPSGSAAPDGTFAAGVNRVTELLPVLMTDIINNAPEDQKEKIKKLVDIWERGYTFPAPMLASFKEKLNAPAPQNVESTTPEGSPAPNYLPIGGAQQQPSNGASSTTPAQSAPDTSSILKALADMAKQNTAAPGVPAVPAPANPLGALNPQRPIPQPVASSVDPASQIQNAQTGVNPYAAGAMAAPFAALSSLAQNPALLPPQSQSQTPPNPLAAAANPLAALLPQATAAPTQATPGLAPDALQQQLQLLQLLAAQGIPQDQWATALQILSLSNPTNMTGLNPGQVPGFNLPGQTATATATAWGTRPESQSRDFERDRERDRDYMRSPPGQYRRRSRSPGWERRRDPSPPRRRDSPVYGEYHGDSPGRRGDMRNRRGNEYRQRSPPGRRRRSPSPPRNDPALPPPGPKFIEWDYSIGQGNIKVLSRTLFVGGVTSSEAHLRSLFGKFGIVQTCIVNIDKRHAFIKMISRQDAISAREGMESYKSGDMQLRTRWGVGFGPRDCSDYQTGISVIPIERLTEADRKWMLTAEYGGTGGRPIESGMVVEEPDIEIGAGVSSKAISRRIATDTGGKRGPVSSRTQQDRFRRPERDGHTVGMGPGGPGSHGERDTSTASNVGVPPAVPGFGFSFPGMPMFPPGFMMGGAQAGPSNGSSQPPPPGQ
ncbi:Nrd1 complex RNA-binding subunit [Aspergillus clavatus NRRL 1]|uniref:RNA binding protein Nrd1, putative n=1 Tax=Aspergillus clavatus (strain ATCC 1007 / CBS 513.65 / DSM 816 / NCTC 3887 / NRRL 1 / QM 1276 / 107) TaxID=344612 RepID=A1C4R3_ASPCL|nr:RNA binding protein Nrd1, putative [Aspergillus clavatus NRRL 1]EAW14681.1 RNA binding protein Nrd1, putative [Aspergillus clavatus NRRL 1]